MSKSKPARGVCRSCGKAWPEHDGIVATCAKLYRACSTLRSLYAWASLRNGEQLTPENVIELVARTLKAIE